MATRKRKSKRKSRRVRKKKLVGGSFSEAGSMLSYFLNSGLNTFTIPGPTTRSSDPRITTQFL